MTYTIRPARIASWGDESTAPHYHNIAPSVDAAIRYLQDRFGSDVKIRVREEASR